MAKGADESGHYDGFARWTIANMGEQKDHSEIRTSWRCSLGERRVGMSLNVDLDLETNLDLDLISLGCWQQRRVVSLAKTINICSSLIKCNLLSRRRKTL